MNEEEIERRLARTTVHFIELGDPDDVLLPLPAFVTRTTLRDHFDAQPGGALEELLSEPSGDLR
ncbi:MAG: hypothetical protein JJD98_02435 [Polaromonas sp.]|nr:hypothetical protein [Polaromonas sp.]